MPKRKRPEGVEEGTPVQANGKKHKRDEKVLNQMKETAVVAPNTPKEAPADAPHTDTPKEGKKKKAFFRKGRTKKSKEDLAEGEEDKKAPKRIKDKERMKAAKLAKASKEHFHESGAQNKALRYLELWANERGLWKFEKCRQIWLLQNAYDEEKINKEKFDTLLQYMGSIQGHMRDRATETAQFYITEDEEWKKLLDEGKTDTEITIDLKKARTATAIVDRARDVIAMLE